MRQHLYLGLLILTLAGCSSSSPVRPAGGHPVYITHHNYLDEELELLWGRDGLPDFPPGLMLLTGLNLKLSPSVLGEGELGALLPRLAERGSPQLFLPFYMTTEGFDDLCGGTYREEMERLAAVLQNYPGKVFLGVGYQPNNALLPTEVASYRTGYGCFVDFLVERGLEEVQYGIYFFGQAPNHNNLPIDAWLPAEGRLEWLGVSGSRTTEPLMKASSRFSERNHPRVVALAAERNIPVYVLDADPYVLGYEKQQRGDTLFRNWYLPTLDYIAKEPRVLGFGHHSRYITIDSTIAAGVRQLLADWYLR